MLAERCVDLGQLQEVEEAQHLGCQDDDHHASRQHEEEGASNMPDHKVVKEEQADSGPLPMAPPPTEQVAEQVS